jgi:hypothetical protein
MVLASGAAGAALRKTLRTNSRQTARPFILFKTNDSWVAQLLMPVARIRSRSLVAVVSVAPVEHSSPTVICRATVSGKRPERPSRPDAASTRPQFIETGVFPLSVRERFKRFADQVGC